MMITYLRFQNIAWFIYIYILIYIHTYLYMLRYVLKYQSPLGGRTEPDAENAAAPSRGEM